MQTAVALLVAWIAAAPPSLDVGEVERDVAHVANGGGLLSVRRMAIRHCVPDHHVCRCFVAHPHGVGGRHGLFCTSRCSKQACVLTSVCSHAQCSLREPHAVVAA